MPAPLGCPNTPGGAASGRRERAKPRYVSPLRAGRLNPHERNTVPIPHGRHEARLRRPDAGSSAELAAGVPVPVPLDPDRRQWREGDASSQNLTEPGLCDRPATAMIPRRRRSRSPVAEPRAASVASLVQPAAHLAPRPTLCYICGRFGYAPVAQWIERLVADQKAAGSTPARRTIITELPVATPQIGTDRPNAPPIGGRKVTQDPFVSAIEAARYGPRIGGSRPQGCGCTSAPYVVSPRTRGRSRRHA